LPVPFLQRDLLASGPFNSPKDGIYPLTGITESNWLPYPFTMNWQMTRPGTVRFEKNEPLCMLFPVPHAALETVEPEILDLDDNPDLKAQTMAWKQRRDEFMKKFYAKDPMTLKEAWQRFYFIGKMPDGSSPQRHVHKLRLDVPVDKRKKLAAKP